jgi:hypothetical protein
MTTYEQQVIDGVPFLTSGTSVFYYDPLALPWSSDPKEPIRIGVLTGTQLRLDEGWKERVQPRIDAWRTAVNPVGRNEIIRAPKQSKPKRSPKSAAKTAGNTVETGTAEGAAAVGTTNVTVIPPEPTPKRIVKRRKVVPANAP